jgi:DNA-binding MarR family transcriptional regulator
MKTTEIPVSELTAILATARAIGLGLASQQTLLLLADQEEINMTALAAEIGVTPASATGTTQRLIGRRHIERTDRSLIDRRVCSIRLTELGRQRVFQLTGHAAFAA